MNRNLAVGLFALLGLALFTVGLFMIGNRHEAFAKHFVVYTEFVDLSGIAKGSKVLVAGMSAGQVEEIRIPDSPAAKFRLKVRLDEKLHGLVRADSMVTIGTEGVVGDTFLAVLPGSVAAPAVAADGVLRSKEPTQLTDLLDQAKGTLGDVDGAIKNANNLLTSVGGNLDATLTTTRGAITDADDLIVGIKRGDGAAGMLLKDPKFAESIRQTLANAQSATKSLQSTSLQADTLMTDIRTRAFPQKIDDVLASVHDATTKVDKTTGDVQKMVADMSAPDERGATAGTNLREAISNMNNASGNLSEDTEALKRNFLVHGFFRRRGYYNLTAIAPNKYRETAAFTSTKNSRVWLDDPHLFVRNGTGEDVLTSEGKSSLDEALAQYSDLLQGTAMMIEGYDATGGATEKSGVSRERALVVRNYLLGRYHLDSMGVGAIGLSDKSPQGSEHAEWDGICIVLLRSGH